MFKRTISIVAVVALVFALAPAAQATFMVDLTKDVHLPCPAGYDEETGLPTGTNPADGEAWEMGDYYHLVLQNSKIPYGQTDPSSREISYYNNWVNACADTSDYPDVPDVVWYCVGSTYHATLNPDGVHAKDNGEGGGVNSQVQASVYRLDTTNGNGLVAEDAAEWWSDTHQALITVNEIMGSDSRDRQHTGTGTDGMATDWPLGGGTDGFVTSGFAERINADWIDEKHGYDTAREESLYIISERIQLAPEPATLVLLGIGGLGLLLKRRR